MPKAQVSTEFFIAAAIVIMLLLAGTIISARQLDLSNQIRKTRENVLECNKISQAISDICLSTGTAGKKILISSAFGGKITIEKIDAGKPGRITVDNFSCNYFGNARIGETLDTAGFTLGEGIYILSKNGDYAAFELQ